MAKITAWVKKQTAYAEMAATCAGVAFIVVGLILFFVYRSWASHRIGPPGEEADRYIFLSDCPEEVSISEAGSGDGRIPSPFVLSGLWEYRGAEDIFGYVDHKVVFPGPNLLDFKAPNPFTGTCEFQLMVTGIALNEPFVVLGPCEAVENQPVEFSAHLIDVNSSIVESDSFFLLVEDGSDIYWVTEEVGRNGEWRIVDKKRVNVPEDKKRPRNNQKR